MRRDWTISRSLGSLHRPLFAGHLSSVEFSFPLAPLPATICRDSTQPHARLTLCCRGSSAQVLVSPAAN